MIGSFRAIVALFYLLTLLLKLFLTHKWNGERFSGDNLGEAGGEDEEKGLRDSSYVCVRHSSPKVDSLQLGSEGAQASREFLGYLLTVGSQ